MKDSGWNCLSWYNKNHKQFGSLQAQLQQARAQFHNKKTPFHLLLLIPQLGSVIIHRNDYV
jgi:hypothetical protein